MSQSDRVRLWAALCVAFACLLVVAVPTVDLGYAPYSMASRHGIRGADAITGIPMILGSETRGHVHGNFYLGSSEGSGHAGELILSEVRNPPTFFLKSGQLFAYVNQSSVLYVNAMETKLPSYGPIVDNQGNFMHEKQHLMRMELSTKKDGVQGEFFWALSSLHFAAVTGPAASTSVKRRADLGKDGLTNGGLWWVCEGKEAHDGRIGRTLYMDYGTPNFRLRRVPTGCEAWTLHSLGSSDY